MDPSTLAVIKQHLKKEKEKEREKDETIAEGTVEETELTENDLNEYVKEMCHELGATGDNLINQFEFERKRKHESKKDEKPKWWPPANSNTKEDDIPTIPFQEVDVGFDREAFSWEEFGKPEDITGNDPKDSGKSALPGKEEKEDVAFSWTQIEEKLREKAENEVKEDSEKGELGYDRQVFLKPSENEQRIPQIPQKPENPKDPLFSDWEEQALEKTPVEPSEKGKEGEPKMDKWFHGWELESLEKTVRQNEASSEKEGPTWEALEERAEKELKAEKKKKSPPRE